MSKVTQLVNGNAEGWTDSKSVVSAILLLRMTGKYDEARWVGPLSKKHTP